MSELSELAFLSQASEPHALTQAFRNFHTPLGISKLGKVIRESFIRIFWHLLLPRNRVLTE